MDVKKLFSVMFLVCVIGIFAWMVLADLYSTDPHIAIIAGAPNASSNISGNTELNATTNESADNLTFIFYNASNNAYVYNITINDTFAATNLTFNVTINTVSIFRDGLYNIVINGTEITNGSTVITIANASITNLAIDNTAPYITAVNTPANNTFYSPALNNELFVINVTITNDSRHTDIHIVNISNGTSDTAGRYRGMSVDYFNNGYLTRTTGNYFNATWNATLNLTEGRNVITVAANDTAGNSNNSITLTANRVVVWYDTTAPTAIHLFTPGHITWTTDTTPDFVFNFSDATSPNASCSVFVDAGTVSATNTSARNYTQTTLTAGTALSLGIHTWGVNCTDLGGNHKRSSVNYTIDIVNKLTLTSPANNTRISATGSTNNTINGTAFVFNYTSGLINTTRDYNVSCELFIQNASGGYNASGVNVSTLNATSTTIYNNQTLTQGNLSWFINCTYNSTIIASNTSFIFVDPVAPMVLLRVDQTLRNWTWTDDSTPDLVFNFTDNTSALASCELFIDGAGYGVNSTTRNVTETTMTANHSLTEGMHDWYVNCTDLGTTLGTSLTTSPRFYFDYRVIVVTTPVDGSWTSETRQDNVSFTFAFNATNATKYTEGASSRGNVSCELWVTNNSSSNLVFVKVGLNSTVVNNTYTTIRNNQSLWPSYGSNPNGVILNWTINCTWNGTQITAASDSYYTLYVDNSTPTVTVTSTGSETSASVTATTSEVCDCRIAGSDLGFSAMTPFETTGGVTTHTTTLSGLLSSTSYGYSVRCSDRANNEVLGTTSFTTTSGVSGSGGGGAGSGAATSAAGQFAKEIWQSVNAGEIATVEVENGEIGVTEVSFEAEKTTYGAWIKVERVESLPSTIGSFDGTVYRNVKITSMNVEKAMKGEAEIKFKVEKGWFAENGIDKNSIALFRYGDDDQWAELSTTKGEEDESYVHYTAKTPGFSYFVIGVKSAAAAVAEGAPTAAAVGEEAPVTGEEAAAAEGVPTEGVKASSKWVWVVPLIAVILVVVALVVYKMRKKKE